ncbi:MAG: hypothetical protein AB7T27_02915 [Kiritimatiellia bacterium]
MKKCLFQIIAAAVISCCASLIARAQVYAGRAMDPLDEDFSITLKPGLITAISGYVKETKRAYTDIPGSQLDYAHYLENYDLEELGFDESYGSLGLGIEKNWRYVTFLLDFSYFEANATATAENEPFAIGVEDVEFEGQSYDYMYIPQGSSADIELQAGTAELGLLLTPFCISTEEGFDFSPWIRGGLLTMAGSYTIDAGPAQGVRTYEYHPYPYVIGGTGEGWAGIVMPEWGFGGEMRIWLNPEGTKIICSGNYMMLDWAGSSESLGVDARNAKDIDLSYKSIDLTALLEHPLSDGVDFLIGGSFRHLETDATIEAQHKTAEEQDAAREKYDKEASFEMNIFYLLVGLRF